MMIMLPESAMRHGQGPLDWHRLHGIDPNRCCEARVFPWARLALFKIFNERDWRLYIEKNIWSGEDEASWSWWVRWMRVRPSKSWCVHR
jgi:hypothetical protein